jgi:hypothetical protein
MAYFGTSFEANSGSLNINVGGYTDFLGDFLIKLFEKIISTELKKDVFEV